jgi:hypothetical protein
VRGGKGEGEGKIKPPRRISKDFLIKNAIKPKSLDLPRDFGKILSYPPPGFTTRVHLWSHFCFQILLVRIRIVSKHNIFKLNTQ